jgi:hypothetical protein
MKRLLAAAMFTVIAVAPPRALACQQAPLAATGSGGIALVRELSIGADQEGPEYEFVAISKTAATHSGSVFVAAYDGSAVQIRRYDASGHFRGTVGRAGAGPGEYQSVDGMAVIGDSVLVVYDKRNGRASLFDTTGGYRSSFRVSGGNFWHKFFAAFSDGTIGVRARVVTAGQNAGGVRSFYVRHRLTGAIVDSIDLPAEEEGGVAVMGPSDGVRLAFPSTTVFAHLPRGGIATASTPRYRIDVVPAAGRPFTIVRDARPIPFERGEREEWEALVERVQAAAPPGRRVTIPREKPIIRDLFADTEGRIWVDLYTQATQPASAAIDRRATLTWSEHSAYDVFDERGGYLGRIDLPPSARLVAVLGSRVWVSEHTEEGFYVLVRYRMAPPEGR